MPPPSAIHQTLRAENAELRARLDEAEQTLRAIRAGEVEALVVEGDAGPRLYTLQGLDAEQNRLRGEMLAQVSDAVLAVDIFDRVTFLNAAAEKKYGVRASDVLGRKRHEVYTNRWPSPEAKAEKEAAQREHGKWRGELIHRTFEGREFPVEVSVTLLRGPDGECTGRVATIRDITKRKEVEAALRRNAALFSEIIEQAPGGVYVVDAQFRVAQMNPESLSFFESAQPVIGRDFDEVLKIVWGPEIGPQCASIFRHTLATGERYVSPRFSEVRHDIGMEQAFEWETQRIILPDGQHGVVCYFQDVTARERVEAALRLSNERFDLAVKCSQAVLWQQDLELRFTWLHNPAPGIDGSDAVGKRDGDLLERAEDAAVIVALKREVIRSGVGVRREFSPQIQGVVHCFEVLMEPLRDAAGLITGLTGAAIDITELKRAEAARQESEKHLRFALQAAAAGAWDWDIRSGEVVWSPENYALYDVDPAQGPTRYEDWESWLHPEDRDRVNAHVRAVLDGREAEFRTEFRIVSRQGAVRWLLGFGRVERDGDGQLLRLSGLNLDITVRKHAEAALRDKERDYRALAEASSEIPYRMSADWSTMLPLEGRNLVASSDQPLADWAWLDRNIPQDEHARIRQSISEAIARKGLFELEHRVRRRDGSTGWVFSRAVPILDENTNVMAWFGAASDITERKRIELSLTHAIAIADKANRAKSDFLSSMSHELRTPLNAILGFAQLLESSAPALAPTQMRHLDQILKGGWYLLELINEILDLALIESGRLSLTREPVSLAEVMRETRAMFEPQARKRGIAMTFPSFDVDGYVRADRTRVKQVLINLLSNAIKYNKAQGAVTVEWTLSPPDSIRLSVRDTGEGLAPQQVAQLFTPFNRLGKESGTEEGTGIGLVMTKRLVEMMGGAMGAESVVGAGSVFWFELKRDSAPQAALQQAAPVRAQARQVLPQGTPPRTVLCVEDNPGNLELIEQLMARRPDLRLLSAGDGNRGIELTRAHQPQVILLDVNLPGISGIEVMKILRADPSTAHIPIVALSANALPGDIEAGIKAGFFNYLTKPIKVTQFMDVLDMALDYSQSATPGRAAEKEQA